MMNRLPLIPYKPLTGFEIAMIRKALPQAMDFLRSRECIRPLKNPAPKPTPAPSLGDDDDSWGEIGDREYYCLP